MAIAAVPGYLGKDFSAASPGLRFGMYLPLWGVNSRTGEKLWTTYDENYRVAGQAREERCYKDENKSAALKNACSLRKDDKACMAALRARQAALAAVVHEAQILRVEAVAVAPFATGLGNEHPLENGFAFLDPYGLPYLAGSGVKGVLRKAAGELAAGLFGGNSGWTFDAIDALFGTANDGGQNEEPGGQRGALIVWDVLPEIAGDALKVEVMTAHMNHYLQGNESPHESGKPNPINFLSVPPKSKFDFTVQCDLPFLQRHAPRLAEAGRWKELMREAIEHAFQWCGFGAKTAVGYGAMQVDPDAEKRRRQAEQERLAKEEEAKAKQAREAELAALTPTQREIETAFENRPDPGWTKLISTFKKLESGAWNGDRKKEIAICLRDMMQAAKKWKEATSAKKPEKDADYQATLQVKRWIEGQ